jgi:D-alanyl-D-alanine carboxypeptidase (penicillin-binding protein 5/6)
MFNHSLYAARRSITSVANAAVVTLALVMTSSLMPVWAQKASSEKSPAPAAVAPSTAAVAATAPSALTPVQVSELSPVPAPAIAARAWITVDVTSGQIVASSNPDMKIEPASLTKIMTAYVRLPPSRKSVFR